MSTESSKESGLIGKIATLFARYISSTLSISGAFPVSKPEGKNEGNKIAYKLSLYVSRYFKVDQDLAYEFIQPLMPEFEVKWAGEEFGEQDDDPALREKVVEIISNCIDSLQVEEGARLAQFISLKPIELANGTKIAGNTKFYIQYTGEEELKMLIKKFSGIARLEKK